MSGINGKDIKSDFSCKNYEKGVRNKRTLKSNYL